MYVGIKFNRAAFKHGVTEADILRAFETFIYEDPIDDADNKYLLLGFNTKGNLIEVIPANENIFRACARIFTVRQGRIGRCVLVAVRKVKPDAALR